jgi:hypothetical protein
MAIETDVGARRGFIQAITAGMIPGIGTTLGTMVTMVTMATTVVGILPGIMEVTIVLGDIGDGTVRDTTLAATTVRAEQAGSIQVVRQVPESEAMAVDALTTAAAIVMVRLAMGRT